MLCVFVAGVQVVDAFGSDDRVPCCRGSRDEQRVRLSSGIPRQTLQIETPHTKTVVATELRI